MFTVTFDSFTMSLVNKNINICPKKNLTDLKLPSMSNTLDYNVQTGTSNDLTLCVGADSAVESLIRL